MYQVSNIGIVSIFFFVHWHRIELDCDVDIRYPALPLHAAVSVLVVCLLPRYHFVFFRPFRYFFVPFHIPTYRFVLTTAGCVSVSAVDNISPRGSVRARRVPEQGGGAAVQAAASRRRLRHDPEPGM